MTTSDLEALGIAVAVLDDDRPHRVDADAIHEGVRALRPARVLARGGRSP